MPGPVPRIELTCGHCRRVFFKMECETNGGRYYKFCSRACAYESKRVWRTCAECGRAFHQPQSEAAKRCCSRACAKAYRRRSAVSYPKIGSRHAHRVIAEQKLGRPLRPGEIVHHDDHDKRNFDPGNLDVIPSQSEHARLHFLGRKHTPEQVRKRVEATRRTKALKAQQRRLAGGSSC